MGSLILYDIVWCIVIVVLYIVYLFVFWFIDKFVIMWGYNYIVIFVLLLLFDLKWIMSLIKLFCCENLINFVEYI